MYIKKYLYEIIDFDKYIEIQKNIRQSKTWFFAFDISLNSRLEKFLLLFHHSLSTSDFYTNQKVSLVVYRDVNKRYAPLLNEPIEIREIFIKDGKLFSLDYVSKSKQREASYIAKKILADIIKEFF